MAYRSSPGSDFVRWLRRILMLLGAFLVVLFSTPLVVWWSEALAHPWESASQGTLVVLSGPTADEASAALSSTSYWRAIYAIRTWRQGHFDRVLIVGRPSAAEMALVIAAGDVPRSRISIDQQSGTTHDAALTVARLAPGLPAPIVLLTSDFNVPLASGAFRKAGLQPVIIPFPDGSKRGQSLSWQHRLGVFADLVEQSRQLVRYRWKGWI